MSVSKKVIAGLGATGAEGGGVVRAIDADANGPFMAQNAGRIPLE